MLHTESQLRTTPEVAVKLSVIDTPARTPTHLLGWLPIVWTRVLFPGASEAPMRWQLRPTLFLFALSGALLYPCVSFSLFEPDEGRYAQIPREMLTSGDWIVPTLQGEPYLDKPPLLYWLVMLSYSLFGYHDGSARLIPALAMHATVLLTYALGRRMVGERSAFWGALLLTVSPLFLGVGRLLVLDGLLALWVTLALLAAYVASNEPEVLTTDESQRLARTSRSSFWWTIAAFACALGVLTKGPVALVLVLVPLLAHRWLTAAPALRWRAWVGFFAIVVGVNAPWYAAVCWRQPEFVRYFLWQHNVERFLDPFDHIRPVWFYIPIMLFGLLPATALAWPLLRFLISTQPAEMNVRCPAIGYLLLAGAWCIGFFSLAGSKLPTYILPAIPPLCLALGCVIARTGWHRSRWLMGLVTACWLILTASHYVVVPMVAQQKSPANPLVIARCSDPATPVVCFPRNVDSVAFGVGRSDFKTYRSKQIGELVQELERNPRTVVLFGHRNSPATLAHHLPLHLRMTDRQPMGLCESAVIVRSPYSARATP